MSARLATSSRCRTVEELRRKVNLKVTIERYFRTTNGLVTSHGDKPLYEDITVVDPP